MDPHIAPDAIALLSGGLDSSVALALAREGGADCLALTIDYGQQAAAPERRAAAAVATHLGIPHQVLRLEAFAEVGGGALLGRGEVPEPDRRELDRGGPPLEQTAAAVWVPNRNGVLVEVAAAHAEARGAGQVVVGFNREEATTFPDNSSDYLERINGALALSTRNQVRVVSPTLDLDKTEILQEARRLGLPLGRLWACYRGGERPCGRCESCQRLRRAADRAGIDLGPDGRGPGG